MPKLLLLLLALGLALLPFTAFAATPQVVVITASPAGNATCVEDFTITIASSYEIQLTWSPAEGGNYTGTMVRGAYDRWPTSPTDGFEVYDGNGSSISHWLSTDVMILSNEGIYYRAWAKLAVGGYTVCYSSGSVTGGEAMDIIGSNMLVVGLLVGLVAMTTVGFAFKVPPLFYLVLLGGAGAGIYLLNTEESLSLGWILGWVFLLLGFLSLFSAYVVLSRQIEEHNMKVDEELARRPKPKSEEEAYAEELVEITRRGRELGRQGRYARMMKKAQRGEY